MSETPNISKDELREALTNLMGDVRLLRGSLYNTMFSLTDTATGNGWKFNADGTYVLGNFSQLHEVLWVTHFPGATGFGASDGSGTQYTFNGTSLSLFKDPIGGADWVKVTWPVLSSGNSTVYYFAPKMAMHLIVAGSPTNNGPQTFMGMGAPAIGYTGITFTNRHIGFKIIREAGSNNLYATQADGTTETAQSLLTGLVANDLLDLIIEVQSSTTTAFYYRKNSGSMTSVLLSTNSPAGTNPAGTDTELSWMSSPGNVADAFNLTFLTTSYRRGQ